MKIIVTLDVMLARRKMSVTQLADAVGITMANISILKTGKAKAIRFSTLEAICEVLNCQPGDILQYDAGEDAAENVPESATAKNSLEKEDETMETVEKIPRATKLVVLPNLKLQITFDNGEVRTWKTYTPKKMTDPETNLRSLGNSWVGNEVTLNDDGSAQFNNIKISATELYEQSEPRQM